jgi:hypothetical protein
MLATDRYAGAVAFTHGAVEQLRHTVQARGVVEFRQLEQQFGP